MVLETPAVVNVARNGGTGYVDASTDATARTLFPVAPIPAKKGPLVPSLPAAMVTTTPNETSREATSAHASLSQPPGAPTDAVMISACRGLLAHKTLPNHS